MLLSIQDLRVAFRIGKGLDVVPLDRFFQDFYYPGLLAAIWRGERPMPGKPFQVNPAPLVNPTDYNCWTNRGEALIRQETKRQLFLNITRNQPQVEAMEAEIYGEGPKQGILSKLRREGQTRSCWREVISGVIVLSRFVCGGRFSKWRNILNFRSAPFQFAT